MTSTGNDIVSLKAINSSRTKQPGFYSKILSTSEQTLFKEQHFETLPFESYVWLLWSIKESAFKYLQRSNPDLIFSPTKCIVQQLQISTGSIDTNFDETETKGLGFENASRAVYKGIIEFETNTLYSRSFIYNELIASVVNEGENFENTYWGIKAINNPDNQYQSKAVREFLVNRLYTLLRRDNLLIGKNSHGFPIVLRGNEEQEISVSLSHHDHFVAYSFQCC